MIVNGNIHLQRLLRFQKQSHDKLHDIPVFALDKDGPKHKSNDVPSFVCTKCVHYVLCTCLHRFALIPRFKIPAAVVGAVDHEQGLYGVVWFTG